METEKYGNQEELHNIKLGTGEKDTEIRRNDTFF